MHASDPSFEQIDEKKKMQTELEDEFALLLAQLASMEEDLGKLLDDKENMPMQEEKRSRKVFCPTPLIDLGVFWGGWGKGRPSPQNFSYVVYANDLWLT